MQKFIRTKKFAESTQLTDEEMQAALARKNRWLKFKNFMKGLAGVGLGAAALYGGSKWYQNGGKDYFNNLMDAGTDFVSKTGDAAVDAGRGIGEATSNEVGRLLGNSVNNQAPAPPPQQSTEPTNNQVPDNPQSANESANNLVNQVTENQAPEASQSVNSQVPETSQSVNESANELVNQVTENQVPETSQSTNSQASEAPQSVNESVNNLVNQVTENQQSANSQVPETSQSVNESANDSANNLVSQVTENQAPETQQSVNNQASETPQSVNDSANNLVNQVTEPQKSTLTPAESNQVNKLYLTAQNENDPEVLAQYISQLSGYIDKDPNISNYINSLEQKLGFLQQNSQLQNQMADNFGNTLNQYRTDLNAYRDKQSEINKFKRAGLDPSKYGVQSLPKPEVPVMDPTIARLYIDKNPNVRLQDKDLYNPYGGKTANELANKAVIESIYGKSHGGVPLNPGQVPSNSIPNQVPIYSQDYLKQFYGK